MWYAAGIAVFLAIAGWLGFRLNPKPYSYRPTTSRDCGSVPVPAGLPAPVDRFARALYGDSIPVIETAYVRGTAGLKLGKIRFPMRFQFFYEVGKSYYHLIEMTWFGFKIVTVHERYQDGVSILALPGNLVDNDPNTNAAAYQGLWAEAIWLPGVYFTDPRVRWEAIDDHSARLILPDAAPEEHFILHFDPRTGLMTQLETCRYQNAGDTARQVWMNHALKWGKINGLPVLIRSETQWGENIPWAIWNVKEVRYNVDVAARIEQFGD